MNLNLIVTAIKKHESHNSCALSRKGVPSHQSAAVVVFLRPSSAQSYAHLAKYFGRDSCNADTKRHIRQGGGRGSNTVPRAWREAGIVGCKSGLSVGTRPATDEKRFRYDGSLLVFFLPNYLGRGNCA